MSHKLVTAFIPSYNYSQYISDAIESILNQSYRHWELIIVDDASTDSSTEIIRTYRDKHPDRIKAVFLKKNVGQAEATNIAISHARGHYISFLAADDIARSNRFSEAVEVLETHPNVGSVYSKVSYIDAEKRALDPEIDVFNREVENLRWQLLEGNFLCSTSVMHRLDVVRSLGGNNRALRHVEDFDLCLRILDEFEIIRVPQVWVDYRLHGRNLSHMKKGKLPFGAFYETVITILSAIERWPLEKLFDLKHPSHSRERRDEEAIAKIKLARHCLRLDTMYFRRPLLCTGVAYRLALEAARTSPDNREVNPLLNDIYSLLGDFLRASGHRSIMISPKGRTAQLNPMKFLINAIRSALAR